MSHRRGVFLAMWFGLFLAGPLERAAARTPFLPEALDGLNRATVGHVG